MSGGVVTAIRLVAGLAVTVGLVYLTGFIMRAVRQARIVSRGRPTMEIRESLALGPGRTLHIVRVGEKHIVVGATPSHVTFLTEVDVPGSRDPGAGGAGGARGRGFREILDALTRRLSDDVSEEDEPEDETNTADSGRGAGGSAQERA